jgi:hypothetical protein
VRAAAAPRVRAASIRASQATSPILSVLEPAKIHFRSERFEKLLSFLQV